MELTPDQKKDRERLERYIAREGLSSVMNQTRWREAIQVLLQTQGYGLRFRVKCLREPEASAIQWESSFPYHVPQPFTAKVHGLIRIPGYLRVPQPPA